MNHRGKSLLAAVFFAAVLGTFATAESYASLLAKGKEYEKNKKYFHALSSYWDAMVAEPTEKAAEAYEAYTTLIELIEDGKPGYGNFDDMFDMYDGWQALLRDYCTMNADEGDICVYPYTITVSKEIKPIMTTRMWRGDVYFSLKPKVAVKSYALYEPLRRGYNKSCTKDWHSGYNPNRWTLDYKDQTTFCEIRSNVEDSINSKIKKAWEEWLTKHKTEAENQFMPVKDYRYVYDGGAPHYKKIIGISRGATWHTWRQSDLKGFPEISWPPLWKLHFALVDKNGKQLYDFELSPDFEASSAYDYDYDRKAFKELECSFEFEEDQETANAIVSGDAHFELLSISYCGVQLDSKLFREPGYDVIAKYRDVTGINLAEFKKNGLAVDDVVRVSNFYIMKTEVTQEQYAAVTNLMNAEMSPIQQDSVPKSEPSKFKGKKRPVESIEWYEAVIYCNRLSKLHGLEPCYSVDGKTDFDLTRMYDSKVEWNKAANGWRLPTEEEWVCAAREGKPKWEEYQYDYSGSNNEDDVAWHPGNSNDETHDVASKKPNGLGLYDMNGNVRELLWLDDGYVANYLKVLGGSYKNFVRTFKNDNPLAWYITGGSDIGFRIVRNVPAEDMTPSPVVNDSDNATTSQKSGKANKSKKSNKSDKSSKSDKKNKSKR